MSDNMSPAQQDVVMGFMEKHSLFRANKLIGNEGTRNKEDMWVALRDLVNLCGPDKTVDQIRDWWTRTRGQAKDYNANEVTFKRLTGNPVEESLLRDKRSERVIEMGGESHNNGLELSPEMGLPVAQLVGVHQSGAKDAAVKKNKPYSRPASLQSVMKSLGKNTILLTEAKKLSLATANSSSSYKSSHRTKEPLPSTSSGECTTFKSQRIPLSTITKGPQSGKFMLVPKPIALLQNAMLVPKPIALLQNAMLVPKPIALLQNAMLVPKPKALLQNAMLVPKPIALLQNASHDPGHTTQQGFEQLVASSTSAAPKLSSRSLHPTPSLPNLRVTGVNNGSGVSSRGAKTILSVSPGSPLFTQLKNSRGKFCLVPISAPSNTAPASPSTIATPRPSPASGMNENSQEAALTTLSPFDIKLNKSSRKKPSATSTSTPQPRVGADANDLYADSMAKSASYSNYHKIYNNKNSMVHRTINSFEQNTAAVVKMTNQMDKLISINQERNVIMEKFYQAQVDK